MDDNPWGVSTQPASPTANPIQLNASNDDVEDAAPAWTAAQEPVQPSHPELDPTSEPAAEDSTTEEVLGTHVEPDQAEVLADESQGNAPDQAPLSDDERADEHSGDSSAELAQSQDSPEAEVMFGSRPASPAADNEAASSDSPPAVATTDDALAPAEPPHAAPAEPEAETVAASDDFGDDGGFAEDEGFGDDDGFGEMGGDDADFGDFGDFDESAGGFEAAAFDEPAVAPPVAAPTPAPAPVRSAPSGLPPLELNWSRPSRKALAPQLELWFESLYPGAAAAMTDEPERQVEGVGQVLVNEAL